MPSADGDPVRDKGELPADRLTIFIETFIMSAASTTYA
jgi:hypothetical protein